MDTEQFSYEYVRVTHDKEARASRLRVGVGAVARTIPAGEQCLIDIDKEGRVLTVELLGPSAEMLAADRPSLALDLVTGTANYYGPAISPRIERSTIQIQNVSVAAKD